MTTANATATRSRPTPTRSRPSAARKELLREAAKLAQLAKPFTVPSALAVRHAQDRSLRRAITAVAIAARTAGAIEDVGQEFYGKSQEWWDVLDILFFCEGILAHFPKSFYANVPNVEISEISNRAASNGRWGSKSGVNNAMATEWLVVTLDRAIHWLHQAGWAADAYGDEKEWTPASRMIVGFERAMRSFTDLLEGETYSFGRQPYEAKIDEILATVE